ncbi:hypothetical protein MBRA1_001223 [Malassezia brasiliensis]|uniref:Uncharacterized protein n=1 Tax=Malassezia brasiliensis TaxID=1821822 RepID=A0AAF0IP67_9BASI|nr:hypothetical protein MBRA1_001223 [Malassezia brasiliensis]
MSDPELEAIRRARMAELRAASGSSSNPRVPGGVTGAGGMGGQAGTDADREEQMAQQEEMKRQLLSQILDSDARERLSRIALVKPQKSKAVTDILIQMARSGQVRQRVSEAQLISLLDQIDQAQPHDTGKITASLQAYITSFLGFMDIKVGSQILTLFSLFNKIAGIYGIIAIFQGGTIAQLSLYIYSIATIPIFIWGLKSISDEQAGSVLRYAHIFILDQMISTGWTFLFTLWWFVYATHDGKPITNSNHQAGLMKLIEDLESEYRTPEEMVKYRHKEYDINTPEGQKEAARRAQAANATWMEERDFAMAVLIGGWLIKLYFALVLYAYALHLRHGTYWMLPLSKSRTANEAHATYQSVPAEEDEVNLSGDEENKAPGHV